MTKTLTEQWREGTLTEGWYYTIIKGIADAEKMMIDYFIPELNHFEIKPTRCIKEVLATVPSYDECNKLVQKMHILEKKLAIATKALKMIERMYSWNEEAAEAAEQTLKEMEGVK